MKKILVVDDNKTNLYVLQLWLKGNGYQVETAMHGREALEYARRAAPLMIISDILMPVMDGFALCREWKKDDLLKTIPFVFYTATYTDPQDEEFALSLGAERFIIKPQEPDDFMAIIKEVMAAHEAGELTVRPLPETADEIFYEEYDRTLIRKLEDKLTQLEEINLALLKSEGRLKLALSAGKMGSFDWDMETDHVIWSDGYFHLLGYKPGDIEPSYKIWAEHVHPSDLSKIEAAINNSRDDNGEYQSEYRVFWPDRSVHWLEGRWSISYDNGRAIRMFGIIIDITKRKKADEELKHYQEHLEELVKERTEKLNTLVSLMAGREVRMADLKKVIKQLRSQILQVGMKPVADDPLLD
ncbi:MAG: response regulator [Chloroflexi bacterium]|nr:MAG: response regulator [Chloroflexota bacterium]